MKLSDLNTNKYFTGIMMILLNLGSRFLVMELSDTQTQMLSKVKSEDEPVESKRI